MFHMNSKNDWGGSNPQTLPQLHIFLLIDRVQNHHQPSNPYFFLCFSMFSRFFLKGFQGKNAKIFSARFARGITLIPFKFPKDLKGKMMKNVRGGRAAALSRLGLLPAEGSPRARNVQKSERRS